MNLPFKVFIKDPTTAHNKMSIRDSQVFTFYLFYMYVFFFMHFLSWYWPNPQWHISKQDVQGSLAEKNTSSKHIRSWSVINCGHWVLFIPEYIKYWRLFLDGHRRNSCWNLPKQLLLMKEGAVCYVFESFWLHNPTDFCCSPAVESIWTLSFCLGIKTVQTRPLSGWCLTSPFDWNILIIAQMVEMGMYCVLAIFYCHFVFFVNLNNLLLHIGTMFFGLIHCDGWKTEFGLCVSSNVDGCNFEQTDILHTNISRGDSVLPNLC